MSLWTVWRLLPYLSSINDDAAAAALCDLLIMSVPAPQPASRFNSLSKTFESGSSLVYYNVYYTVSPSCPILVPLPQIAHAHSHPYINIRLRSTLMRWPHVGLSTFLPYFENVYHVTQTSSTRTAFLNPRNKNKKTMARSI